VFVIVWCAGVVGYPFTTGHAFQEAAADTTKEFMGEMTPELARAIKTIDSCLRQMRPRRRVGNPAEVKRRTQSEFGLTDAQYGLWTAIRTVAVDYGATRSFVSGLPTSGHGRPMPKYTFPLIEWLDQLDLSRDTVLEFGAGMSTLFWAARARRVVALENNVEWLSSVRAAAGSNVEIVDASLGLPMSSWRQGAHNMGDALKDQSLFDIIVVDGAGNRFLMAKEAVKRLAPDGIIILDNTMWYPKTATWLRRRMLQIDFHGLKPTQLHADTTSVFFNRVPWRLPSTSVSMPGYPVGGQVTTFVSGWDQVPSEVFIEDDDHLRAKCLVSRQMPSRRRIIELLMPGDPACRGQTASLEPSRWLCSNTTALEPLESASCSVQLPPPRVVRLLASSLVPGGIFLMSVPPSAQAANEAVALISQAGLCVLPAPESSSLLSLAGLVAETTDFTHTLVARRPDTLSECANTTNPDASRRAGTVAVMEGPRVPIAAASDLRDLVRDVGAAPVIVRRSIPSTGFDPESIGSSLTVLHPYLMETGGPSACLYHENNAFWERWGDHIGRGSWPNITDCPKPPMSADLMSTCETPTLNPGIRAWAWSDLASVFNSSKLAALAEEGCSLAGLSDCHSRLRVSSQDMIWHMHYDVSPNLITVLHGRKRVWLAGPDLYRAMYLYPSFHTYERKSQVPLDWVAALREKGAAWERIRLRFPDFVTGIERKHITEVVLEAGESLFVPGYTFHATESLGCSTYLTQWLEPSTSSALTHEMKNAVLMDRRSFSRLDETSLRAYWVSVLRSVFGENAKNQMESLLRSRSYYGPPATCSDDLGWPRAKVVETLMPLPPWLQEHMAVSRMEAGDLSANMLVVEGLLPPADVIRWMWSIVNCLR